VKWFLHLSPPVTIFCGAPGVVTIARQPVDINLNFNSFCQQHTQYDTSHSAVILYIRARGGKGGGVLSTRIFYRARICKRFWSLGIDSEELIPPAYVAWRAGPTNRDVVSDRQTLNICLRPHAIAVL
jgi:hypothetical protein